MSGSEAASLARRLRAACAALEVIRRRIDGWAYVAGIIRRIFGVRI